VKRRLAKKRWFSMMVNGEANMLIKVVGKYRATRERENRR